MPSKKDDRRRRATERQEARAQRTPEEQLRLLDERFGPGLGAAKERARLQALIDKAEQERRAEQEKKGKRKEGKGEKD